MKTKIIKFIHAVNTAIATAYLTVFVVYLIVIPLFVYPSTTLVSWDKSTGLLEDFMDEHSISVIVTIAAIYLSLAFVILGNLSADDDKKAKKYNEEIMKALSIGKALVLVFKKLITFSFKRVTIERLIIGQGLIIASLPLIQLILLATTPPTNLKETPEETREETREKTREKTPCEKQLGDYIMVLFWGDIEQIYYDCNLELKTSVFLVSVYSLYILVVLGLIAKLNLHKRKEKATERRK